MNWSDFFSYFTPREDITNPSKRDARRPAPRDWTDTHVCNIDMTRGLYHNSYPGMKLAGGLSYAPIIVPIWFMGLPVATSENEKTQENLKLITEAFARDMTRIHIESHRDGTCWIWPHYSSRENQLVWEFIPDDTITDIIRDLDSGKVLRIITDEEIKITTGYNQIVNIRRKRTFDEKTITIEWISGKSSVPQNLLDRTSLNPAGILPIPFANNHEGESVRGYSDLERIITDLKNYHDIELKLSSALAKFNPKLVLGVRDVDQWKKDNGITDINEIDVEKIDLLFYIKEMEAPPEILYPQYINDAYDAELKRIFWKMIEESMIPEIAWGIKVEGNLASADKQIEGLVKYVEDKRAQHSGAYRKLFEASLQLLNMTQIRREREQIKIEWNRLDAISEETKSLIFQNFASGIGALINVAGLTKEQLHKLWLAMYPQSTEQDYEKFKIGISEMGAHNQWRQAQYIDVMDMAGDENNPPLEDQKE